MAQRIQVQFYGYCVEPPFIYVTMELCDRGAALRVSQLCFYMSSDSEPNLICAKVACWTFCSQQARFPWCSDCSLPSAVSTLLNFFTKQALSVYSKVRPGPDSGPMSYLDAI